MSATTLKERIAIILNRQPDLNRNYYAVTLLGKEDGNLEWAVYSHWVGFADEDRKIELRTASIVRAQNIADVWLELGESCAVVNDLEDMEIFFLIGGNGLIDKIIGESVIAEWLKPLPVVQSGPAGFVHIENLPKGAFNKAPTPKQRMHVLKRDDYRCRICGRRATDYVDIELHVHHIRPWERRGLTEDSNLITLCHTCHKGLEPHFDLNLYELLEPENKEKRRVHRAERYWRGVRLYREKVVQEFSRGGDTSLKDCT